MQRLPQRPEPPQAKFTISCFGCISTIALSIILWFAAVGMGWKIYDWIVS